MDSLTESERHHLLSDDRRRLTLDILADRTASIELKTLAAEVAEREGGFEADNEDAVERVKVTLHHHHLPKLAAFGVLDYDPEAHRITP